MSEYLHGAYGQIQPVGARVAEESQSAIVYVGTAPVHNIEGGAAYVNKPIAIHNIAEAKKYFGYSDEWDKYTLCEAMHVHLEKKGVGPLVLINVLNPSTHKKGTKGTVSKTPSNGRIIIDAAQDIVLDSLVLSITVEGETTTFIKGTHYAAAYSFDKKNIVITELYSGALGSAAITITYDVVDPGAVTDNDVIGSTDGAGLNTGMFAMANVYQQTGFVPAFFACPGFSSSPDVHNAMFQNSQKINGHWDAYMFVDLPIVYDSTAITLDSAAAFKAANGYTHENETVYFPLAMGKDGKTYHLSVLSAANFQKLLIENDSIPWKTASNTEVDLIENLYLGASSVGRVYDDDTINNKLCKNGIASAAFVGGRWAIWGCHSADYNQTDADQINIAETNRMMLYYLSNDFQHRRPADVDKPMTNNDLQTIIAEEQTRIDALLKVGALIYGEVHLNAEAQAQSDIMNGDYSFVFNVTTTPLAKSLTAVINWTDAGFVSYFETEAE